MTSRNAFSLSWWPKKLCSFKGFNFFTQYKHASRFVRGLDLCTPVVFFAATALNDGSRHSLRYTHAQEVAAGNKMEEMRANEEIVRAKRLDGEANRQRKADDRRRAQTIQERKVP